MKAVMRLKCVKVITSRSNASNKQLNGLATSQVKIS